MVFTSYFLKRFFKYAITVSVLLSMIVSFVEFFEKMVHTKLTTIPTILKFIGINFIPSLFDLLPIACWLGSCLLIKEFYQQNEWESFAVLNIGTKTILRLAFVSGIMFAGLSLTCRELFVEKMVFNADRFKMENFKQKPSQKIVNRWVEVGPDMFAYFSMLDFSNNNGSDLFILSVDSDFTIQKVLTTPFFNFNPENNSIFIPAGTQFEISDNVQEKLTDKTLILPTFFSQIQINMEPMTIKNLLKTLPAQSSLPKFVQNSLKYQLVNKIVFYIKLILYPVLTFALFTMFWHTTFLKWAVILSPYPFFMGYSLLSDYLFSSGVNPWHLILPYLLILFVIYLLFFSKLFKKYNF